MSSLRNGINHIPHASNVYRSHFYSEGLAAETMQHNVSNATANTWNASSDEKKELWKERSEHDKEVCALRYPDYRPRPADKASVSKAVTAKSTPSERIDVATGAGQTANDKPTCDCAVDRRPSTFRSKSSEHVYVPRPANAFMLFRSDVYRKGLVDENPQDDLSIAAGKIWNSLSDEQKAPWVERARQVREEHAQRYPGYRFRPGNRMTIREAMTKPAPGRKGKANSRQLGCTSTVN